MAADKDGDRSPNPVDVHVGQRIRMRRKVLGVSQERLADELGLTFQQVQKYERGANRVCASKLYDIARALQMDITAFFEGLAKPHEANAPAAVQEAGTAFVHDLAATPEGLELAALLPRMDRRRRRMLLDLARTLANDAAADGEAADPVGAAGG